MIIEKVGDFLVEKIQVELRNQIMQSIVKLDDKAGLMGKIIAGDYCGCNCIVPKSVGERVAINDDIYAVCDTKKLIIFEYEEGE